MTAAPSTVPAPTDHNLPDPWGPAWERLPPIDLRQLQRLSDDTGIFQHAVHALPDPNHGYCIDDNARALIAALRHAQVRDHDERVTPTSRYLAFLAYAYNPDTGAFRNFMGYNRQWLEAQGSQDSQGRTFWALGLAIAHAPGESIRGLAQNVMLRALPAIKDFQWIRSWGFALIGLELYLRHDPDHGQVRELRDLCLDRLFDAWKQNATDDWPWWEPLVTYDNAKLCHALLLGGVSTGRAEVRDAALKSLRWLLDVQTETDDQGRPYLSVIGNDGWLTPGPDGKPTRATYDQQPLEAYAMVDALLEAAQVTGESRWADDAWMCFQWFLGRNVDDVPLYHAETGGCQDGLQADGPNKNQGAESVLAYLLSVLALHRYDASRSGGLRVSGPAQIGYAFVGDPAQAAVCRRRYADIDGLAMRGQYLRDGDGDTDQTVGDGATTYSDVDRLINDPRVTLVHLAGRPDHHAELAGAALRAGKHVVVDSPLATGLVDAQSVVEAGRTRDRVVAINHIPAYGPLQQVVLDLLDSGLLGEALRGTVIEAASDADLPEGHWFWDADISGGLLVQLATPWFELVSGLLGEGQVVCAQRLRRPGREVVDQATCEARYGAQCTVSSYHGLIRSPLGERAELRLTCERGELRLTGRVARRLELQAVVSHDQAQRLESLIAKHLDGAAVQTLRTFEGDDRAAKRRWQHESIDRELLITWQDPRDQHAVSDAAAADLMRDVAAAIQDPHHRCRVAAGRSLGSLRMAVEATHRAGRR
jgi:predicted dehydrogenase